MVTYFSSSSCIFAAAAAITFLSTPSMTSALGINNQATIRYLSEATIFNAITDTKVTVDEVPEIMGEPSSEEHSSNNTAVVAIEKPGEVASASEMTKVEGTDTVSSGPETQGKHQANESETANNSNKHKGNGNNNHHNGDHNSGPHNNGNNKNHFGNVNHSAGNHNNNKGNAHSGNNHTDTNVASHAGNGNKNHNGNGGNHQSPANKSTNGSNHSGNNGNHNGNSSKNHNGNNNSNRGNHLSPANVNSNGSNHSGKNGNHGHNSNKNHGGNNNHSNSNENIKQHQAAGVLLASSNTESTMPASIMYSFLFMGGMMLGGILGYFAKNFEVIIRKKEKKVVTMKTEDTVELFHEEVVPVDTAEIV